MFEALSDNIVLEEINARTVGTEIIRIIITVKNETRKLTNRLTVHTRVTLYYVSNLFLKINRYS